MKKGHFLENETRLALAASIIESSEDAIIGRTLEGIVTAWNPGAERLYGYSAEEVIGRQMSLHVPAGAGEIARNLERIQHGEVIESFETVRIRKDGTRIDVSLTRSPIRNSSGEIIGSSTIARDITLRRRSEESIQKLARAVEQAKNVIFMTDPDGRINYANPAFEEVYGYPVPHALGKTPRILKSGRHDKAFYERFWQRLLAGESLRQEFINKARDGRFVTTEASVSPVLDPQGRRIGFIAVQEDITDRKAAEERIRTLNRLLKTISEVNSLLIKVADEESLLQGVCRILVGSGSYLLTWIGKADPGTMRAVPVARAGRDAHLVDSLGVRWDDSPEGRGPFGTAIRTGRHVVVQDTGSDSSITPWRTFSSRLGIRSMAVLPLHRGGAVTAALVAYAAVPSFIDEEEITLLDELAEDISFALDVLDARERARKGEQELRRLSRTVEQTPASIVITDLEGRIEYVNPGFTRVTGYTAEDVRDQNPRILKSDRTSPEVIRQLWETITAGGDWYGELCNRRKDGTYYWEQASISPIRDDKGAITHYVSVGEDVTARKSAAEELAATQQQLLQAQKMEAVGRLAGGVAHDFNNLLTAILGYAELLASKVPPDSGLREELGEIREAGERAAGLTRQLLAFSRKQVLQPEVLRLNDLVENVEKMLRRVIGEDVELVTRLDASGGSVRADPGQLEQVIVNLAVNARDAMPKGGRLTIETADVVLDSAYAGQHAVVPPGRYTMLAVSDTGVGMDAATQERLFEPFFTTKEKGKGTGLGLSTVYGIVKQSGGYIWVYSEPGMGTTFKVYLPRVDEAALVLPARSTESIPALGTETILLVEDEPAIRALSRRVLEASGYRVLEAGNGTDALERARTEEGPIHLLLTDLVMPNMGGSDLASRLQELRPDIRVLFMSGYTDDGVVRGGLLGQGQAFLQKPFTPQGLARKVRELLDAPGQSPAA